MRLTGEVIPEDSDRPDYRLTSDLKKFRRVKKHGLPPRYRLFWVFSSRAKAIIFLYLNDEATLRGAARDPYAVFAAKRRRGEIGKDLDADVLAAASARRTPQKRAR